MVDGLQQEYDGTVEFKLYNVEESAEGAELMTKYGAQFVPTFVFLNADGSTAKTIVGGTEAELREALEALK